MLLKIILICSWVLNSSLFYLGAVDIPFFDQSPICFDRFDDEPSFYDFENSILPFEKRIDTSVYPDIPIYSPSSQPYTTSNGPDLQYLPGISSLYNPHLRLKKRSITKDEERAKDYNNDQERFEANFFPHFVRPVRYNENIKTIHVPSSFTPRLGRKRSEVETDNDNNYKAKVIVGRSRIIDLKAGNAFTPRLGRSEGNTKIHLSAGSAFTPRLGRADGLPRNRLNTGNAFTPHLGRSNNSNRVLLNAGGAFTPRLGRSENNNRIHLNAGNAFTPRLGRSDNYKLFYSGDNDLTSRMERSEGGNKIQLNAGSAFTPRLG